MDTYDECISHVSAITRFGVTQTWENIVLIINKFVLIMPACVYSVISDSL